MNMPCPAGEQDNDENGTCLPACTVDTCGSNAVCDDSSGEATCSCLEGYDDVEGTCIAPPSCDDVTCGEHTVGCDDSAGEVQCLCENWYSDGDQDRNCEFDCTSESNLIDECSFPATIDGWAGAFNATVLHSTAIGLNDSTSMVATKVGLEGQANWSVQYEKCFSFDGERSFGAWIKHYGGEPVTQCLVESRRFSGSSDCSGSSTRESGSWIKLTSDWTLVEHAFASSSGESLMLGINCSGGSEGTQVAIDEVFLGTVPTQ